MSGSLSTKERELLEELFDRAADLPPEDHGAFVARECPAPGALRDALEGLLRGLLGDDVLQQLQDGGPSLAGERIGHYVLRERIGGGGMGEVYAADQLEPVERRVAVKFIRAGMDSAQFVARFEAERQALARMAHAHVAQVYDAGSTPDGRPYFVMELVMGEPITDYCDTHRLSTRDRLELFIGVCEGVEHAHQKGLIHRDLKPSNLLVTEQDGRAVPKIIDFGVARATTGRLGDESLLTMAGQVVGTLDYMSPEQAAAGEATIDTRSDVYSLGVVLYQLLTGLLPHERASTAPGDLAEIQRAIREDEPQTPSRRFRLEAATKEGRAPLHGTDERSLVRQLAGDLDWISLKALEKDPARRYQSPAELAADIRRHLTHLPVHARRPGAFYRTGKFIRRHRVAVAAGAVVTAALVTGIAGVVSGQVQAAARGKKLAQLSDGMRLDRLNTEADKLWPLDPVSVPLRRLDLWLDHAHDLISHLDAHRQTMAALVRASSADETVTDDMDWNTVGFERRWQLDEVAELVEGIEQLERELVAADAIGESHGWSIPLRIAATREFEESFAPGGLHHTAWLEALPLIHSQRADLDMDGEPELVYPGLELEMQMGLVPLGPDPDSHLWEFADLATGEPVRRVDGRLVHTHKTGLVFVLLPGGTYLMGSQFRDPERPNYVTRGDFGPQEGPVHTADVEPFFLSKYEMTAGQWERSCGRNPSEYGPAGPPLPERAAVLPVQMVTWDDCTVVMGRFGFCLPTEEQWEYAARGGLDWARWTGPDAASIEYCENILDESAQGVFVAVDALGTPAPFSDGEPGRASVGSYDGNPFGLHDMLGNVSEWTSSHPGKYAEDWVPLPETLSRYLARGGNFRSGSEIARAAFRGYNNVPSFAVPVLGLRPARGIDGQ